MPGAQGSTECDDSHVDVAHTGSWCAVVMLTKQAPCRVGGVYLAPETHASYSTCSTVKPLSITVEWIASVHAGAYALNGGPTVVECRT